MTSVCAWRPGGEKAFIRHALYDLISMSSDEMSNVFCNCKKTKETKKQEMTPLNSLEKSHSFSFKFTGVDG